MQQLLMLPSKRRNVSPKAQLTNHQPRQYRDKERNGEGHDGEHEEVPDEGLQPEEDGAGSVDGEAEGGRERSFDEGEGGGS